MKIIKNTGNERVVDVLRRYLSPEASFDIASPAFSIFAYAELREILDNLTKCRLVLSGEMTTELLLLGSVADRPFRNQLQIRWLARQCASWLEKIAEVRYAPEALPQSTLIASPSEPSQAQTITGNCPFTSEGLGITPGNQFSLIQISESAEENTLLSSWFTNLWDGLQSSPAAKNKLCVRLKELSEHKQPALVYFQILHRLFSDLGEQLDEDKIVKSATGIRDTKVWQKLYKFQRDGVIGAIDKLERHGGCIIADSVGLGKTFEALAIIKYYELRNDRVLVLCPKRLRDNWTIYKANDRRNILSTDRFNYDVLNHTDLSRDGGISGDIDLAHINWGNYDLLVIDESHNFRNKAPHKEHETRYDRLMKRIIKDGVKTRVLMLSATPVNNRLADLKNQIAFATEGNEEALAEHGLTSIETTVRQAQLQFNRWLKLNEAERKPAKLIDMLGFDYFKLLDLLTIARSRKHIEKYYGTAETGKFPERLKPINIKADVDRAGEFRPIRDINNEIRRLNLSAYAPMRYVLPHKQAAYEAKYGTKLQSGERYFRQLDREESLIHLLRVNILKRMESSVTSFTLTLERQLEDVKKLLSKINAHVDTIEEVSITDVEIDDPTFESLLIGKKVKVLLQDVDRVRWRQDLEEDRDRLHALLSIAKRVGPSRDAKLEELKTVIVQKFERPINDGNRKVMVFTAFADTAEYLYGELSRWAKEKLKISSAIVTGSGRNKSTLSGLRTDLGSILSAFSPRSKERSQEFSGEGEIDLLIATDCISEGQNLQDCDFLINYDIHWNPVRIIQRFGRIDRIGSPNTAIQLVNFWPNMELEEYINLEQRVSGRMVLLDISATGEENIIEQESGNQMNDLEYRRKQLLKLQDAVIDLEDLSSGISIADLTLNDFRVDLAGFVKEHPGKLDQLLLGTFAVTEINDRDDASIPPGVIFCLRAEGPAAVNYAEPCYPLAPYYLVYVGEDGSVLLPYTQAKQVLDRLKKLCISRNQPDTKACARYDKITKDGKDMTAAQELLAKAVASVAGKKEERAVASLFTPGGTHAMKGEFQGMNDFEVVAFVVILPEASK
jgi:hypothetical protein